MPWQPFRLPQVGERAMQGSIFTVFELHSGDASNGAGKALDHLLPRGQYK